jgi:hypothetical protein
MSVALTAAEVLRQHVTLEVECIDRMYLNGYVPQLQTERGVACFFKFHRRQAPACSQSKSKIGNGYFYLDQRPAQTVR